MLEAFFTPRSVAVVGASKDQTKFGRLILNNMALAFYPKIYPVNPKADEILSIPCYRSLSELPETPELVVCAIPSKPTVEVVRECGELGVRAIIVISSGFKEVGNHELEEQLVKNKQNARIIGPNCLGVWDTYSGVNTLFAQIGQVRKGGISLISQSGAIGVDLLVKFGVSNVGLSKFASYGNASDVQETDLLEHFGDDPNTKTIGLYLEGVKGGRDFLEVAKVVAKKKPVVALKIGGKDVSLASLSHTGSIAGSKQVFEQVSKQSGIITVDSTEEFVDVLKALSYQKPMKGRKIAIVSNVGGPAALAMHRAAIRKLRIGSLTTEGVEELSQLLLVERIDTQVIRKDNGNGEAMAYMDLTGNATTEIITTVSKIVLEKGDVDGLLLIPRTDAPIVSRDCPTQVTLLKKKFPKIPFVLYNLEVDKRVNEEFEQQNLPVYHSSERAIDGLWALAERGAALKRLGVSKDHW